MADLDETMEIEVINEGSDIKRRITYITSKIKEYQDKVKEIISSYYVDFVPSCYANVSIMKNGKMLEDDINKVVGLINQDTSWQHQTTQETMQHYREELSEAILGYKTSFKLQTIHSLFEMITRSGDDHQKLIQILEKIKLLLNDGTDPILTRLECYQNIRLRYHEEYQILLNNLHKKFESLIQFNEKPFQNMKTVTIRIKKDEDKLHQVITALIQTNYNVQRICKFLMDNVFEPIITRPVSLTSNEDEGDFVTLQLSYQLKSSDDLRPNYKTIFQKIMETFYCLGHMNIIISEHQCIFSIIAKHIKGDFCKLLIESCLQNDIPDTITEMNECNIIQAIQEFNKFLKDMLFLDNENDQALDEYASKIEVLFQKKFCMNIMTSAIDIMKKDLHEMVLIEECEYNFSNGSDIFSSCMVSKSAIELKKLLDKIVAEAMSSEKHLSDRLLKTIAIILERYTIEVSHNHEKLLLKIPQQTALFHNNCLYLSFWMQKNASKLDGGNSFVLIGNALRDQGTKTFNSQLQNQRAVLLQSLEGFDLADTVVELGPEPQKAIRQCMRQLDVLKSVWQTVLTEHVYKTSMGGLLTLLCAEIIKRIFKLDDITDSMGHGLVDVIGIMQEKAPQLFKNPTDITIIVKNWMKLVQLSKILDASLVEITEMWAEGKGPLTLNFKSEDIKHLIKALFQNTKHRQICLASIIQP
ncbi:centromere/kinetochore protein zw10 [Toxorhynchites rutilus septentrionalis]|uniref:centromere/kinetochore protein zw10 n=1 Tax=Toxorhynchites rutilus septentrionalis TaxID=329112 RepID=UPI00247A3762|nr:centromere/kinetochore protein zw10 [Toxorhynchites rutilus septentrionalis]XP_055637237.1 centromere/kinetochore protein zw10 [Toxorhynchites rutilus septentrionalis]